MFTEGKAFPPRATPRQRARLIRRFELTIPNPKPLKVRYYDIMGRTVCEAIGLPAVVRAQMIYLRLNPAKMQAIPTLNIVDIRPLFG